MINFQINNYSTAQPSEWTNAISYNGTKCIGITARGTSGTQEFDQADYTTSHPYRCVFAPTN